MTLAPLWSDGIDAAPRFIERARQAVWSAAAIASIVDRNRCGT